MKVFKTTLLLLICVSVYSQDLTVPLYKEKIPFKKNISFPENIEMDGKNIRKISLISVPEILVFKPKNREGEKTSAVLICPGGGYSFLAFTHEGIEVAKWLNSLGVTGIVLKSRLPDDRLMKDKGIVPLTDAQIAMEIIRKNAKDWNINPGKIGVMGFSAGGHLAASLSTHYTTLQRPDFSILVYPVITMDSTFTHMGSRQKLLGSNPSRQTILNFSNELQVTTDSPPAFLIHSADDDVVPIANSISYFEALIEKGIHKSELFIFQNGGHGYGLANKMDGNVAMWPDLLKGWLLQNKWMREQY